MRARGRRLAVAVDARRDMAYVQLFGDDCIETSEVMLLTHEGAARLIGQSPVLIVGSGSGRSCRRGQSRRR